MYLAAGIRLFPLTPEKGIPCFNGWNQIEVRKKHGITTPEGLEKAWQNGVRRFGFLPHDDGLVIIDTDRKKGKDGLKALKYAAPGAHFPVYTCTPSGGFHFYFRTKNAYKSRDIYNGFECISARHLCTAGGSMRKNDDGTDGEYEFHGDIADAPALEDYPGIVALLHADKRSAGLTQSPHSASKRESVHKQSNAGSKRRTSPSRGTEHKEWGLPELWERAVSRHGNGKGVRHGLRVCFAGLCIKKEISAYECTQYALCHISREGKPWHVISRETEDDIRSAYKQYA